MAQRGIREFDAKRLFFRHVYGMDYSCVLIGPDTDMEKLPERHAWLNKERLVAKPDQLFGKRGKNSLVSLDKNWDETKKWVKERMGKEVVVGGIAGVLTHFLVEPFIRHSGEYYLSFVACRECDRIMFSESGGVDVEAHMDSMRTAELPVLQNGTDMKLDPLLPKNDANGMKSFVSKVYEFFKKYGLTYLEFNPFSVSGGRFVPLDMVAKMDDTALLNNGASHIDFPSPFGRLLTKEEAFIRELDENSHASLKLTVLNPQGRIWTMVAGGGASVIFADTIADLGYAGELANYGEYSGDPTTEETYQYARTILDLMTRVRDPKGRGKILIIGGGIANFTDVAATFAGIIKALGEYAPKLRQIGAKVFVRRGGPRYQKGLEMMRETGKNLGLDISVHGPEMHMTRIVRLAMEG